jgi:hypothetical protein
MSEEEERFRKITTFNADTEVQENGLRAFLNHFMTARRRMQSKIEKIEEMIQHLPELRMKVKVIGEIMEFQKAKAKAERNVSKQKQMTLLALQKNLAQQQQELLADTMMELGVRKFGDVGVFSQEKVKSSGAKRVPFYFFYCVIIIIIIRKLSQLYFILFICIHRKRLLVLRHPHEVAREVILETLVQKFLRTHLSLI